MNGRAQGAVIGESMHVGSREETTHALPALAIGRPQRESPRTSMLGGEF